MPLTEREKHTQKRYDVLAREWLSGIGVEGKMGKDRPCFWSEEMKEFAACLGGNRMVLEVGCGPATDGVYLSKFDISVVSTDYSTTMLSIAKEIKPEGNYLNMDMQDLGLPKNYFDGFWATACLLHLENPDKGLRELARVTKKGGVGFISIKEGDGETIDPRTEYYFHYYHHPDFVRKLRRLGLETIKSGRKAYTPNHDYLTYLVKVVK